MDTIAYKSLLKSVVGRCVDRPNRVGNGTLSGHAAGEPFEKLVYHMLKEEYPCHIYKQHEYLNELYLKHSKVVTAQERYELVQSPAAAYLLNRGQETTASWSPMHPFVEKQNDTADILFHRQGYYELIDIKTHNKNKRSQPPNIISAYKLAMVCKCMIDNEEYDTIGLKYVGVEWEEIGDQLVCTGASMADMFKTPPDTLYINWAAGLQIQNHVSDFDQTWNKDTEHWVVAFLKMFVASARNRCAVMEEKFITPFLPYLAEE